MAKSEDGGPPGGLESWEIPKFTEDVNVWGDPKASGTPSHGGQEGSAEGPAEAAAGVSTERLGTGSAEGYEPLHSETSYPGNAAGSAAGAGAVACAGARGVNGGSTSVPAARGRSPSGERLPVRRVSRSRGGSAGGSAGGAAGGATPMEGVEVQGGEPAKGAPAPWQRPSTCEASEGRRGKKKGKTPPIDPALAEVIKELESHNLTVITEAALPKFTPADLVGDLDLFLSLLIALLVLFFIPLCAVLSALTIAGLSL